MAASRSTQRRTNAGSNTRSAVIWGTLAFCSILAVCTLIALKLDVTRDGTLIASTTPPPARPVIRKSPDVSEFEIARLNDAVRTLASERDRLASRVETLEQSVGDITASISTAKKPDPTPAPAAEKAKQEAPVASAEPQAVKPAISAAPEPAAPKEEIKAEAKPDVKAEVKPEIKPVTETPAPASYTPPQTFLSAIPSPNAKQPVPFLSALSELAGKMPPQAEKPVVAHSNPVGRVERPNRVVRTNATNTQKTSSHHKKASKVAQSGFVPVPPPAPHRPTAATAKTPATQVAQILPSTAPEVTGATRTEFGVDLGGETSLDGLRARWATIKGNHHGALEGLHPLVRVREGSRPGTVELHLIAGPVANAGTAARVCAKLQSTGIACQASEYDGQRLSIR